MAATYACDKTHDRIGRLDMSVLRLSGPIQVHCGTKEIHLSDAAARQLARWLNRTPPDELATEPARSTKK